MDRLHQLAVFVAVAEEGGFAAGARRLGISPPAVTRVVAALEDHLGVKLLARTTRFVKPTEAGLRYLEDARRILAELEEADNAAMGMNALPRGQLNVTAPVMFGRMYVMPSIVAYLRQFPDVKVSSLFLDRIVNLVEEDVDVGIRIGELPDSGLNAVGVGHVRRMVCAAPGYLDAHGIPATPEALAAHVVVASTSVSPTVEWTFFKEHAPLRVKVRPRLTVSSNDAAIEAAVRGFGVTRLLSYQVAPHLAAGTLVEVLAAYQPRPLPIHVVYREGRRSPAKVRAFVDLMVAQLRAEAALQ